MKIARTDVPDQINVPGAIVRQMKGFGDASEYGQMAGEYLTLAAGTDLAPLLEGLDHDLCQSPHWGYLIEGEVTVTYRDGSSEAIDGGDLFYWPPGHTVAVVRDAEIVLFSPQAEHCAVVEHVKAKLGA